MEPIDKVSQLKIKRKIRITTQQILVRKYLVNPIFRTDKPFFFREGLFIAYMVCTKQYIQDSKF